MVGILLVLGVILLLWLYDKNSRPKNYPPGPFVFPVLGIFPHFIFGNFEDSMARWKQKYGKIFSIKFGPNNAVVIHDLELIKEAFNRDDFTGRPFLGPIRVVAGEERRGFIASEGAQWEAQRRFGLRNLRDFGFGKMSSEVMAHEDIADLIEKFRKDTGQPISVADRFNMSVINSLWYIISGQRHDIDDPNFKAILAKLKVAISTLSNNVPAFAMEWLTDLAPEMTGWNKFKNSMGEAKDFIREQMEYHKSSFQEGSYRDFMDVFINEINHTSDPNSAFYKIAGEENLLVGSLNLFGAGTETTSSTLTWALFFLSRNPSIQQKFQKEIDEVVGRSRLPSLKDKESMPYASATILEVFRMSALSPLGIPHSTMKDVNFHGFWIPKGTIILGNLYDVHHNKEDWGDPEVFRPERFLTPNEKEMSKNHPPIAPFSIGRRQCLGETLARNNVFLFLVSLFQVFDIKEPANGVVRKKPAGLFRFPPEFQVIFEERQ